MAKYSTLTLMSPVLDHAQIWRIAMSAFLLNFSMASVVAVQDSIFPSKNANLNLLSSSIRANYFVVSILILYRTFLVLANHSWHLFRSGSIVLLLSWSQKLTGLALSGEILLPVQVGRCCGAEKYQRSLYASVSASNGHFVHLNLRLPCIRFAYNTQMSYLMLPKASSLPGYWIWRWWTCVGFDLSQAIHSLPDRNLDEGACYFADVLCTCLLLHKSKGLCTVGCVPSVLSSVSSIFSTYSEIFDVRGWLATTTSGGTALKQFEKGEYRLRECANAGILKRIRFAYSSLWIR